MHPNFPEKHEARHRPALHKGVVLKHNANQRCVLPHAAPPYALLTRQRLRSYASNAVTVFLLREIARRHSLPLQEFVVRQDMGCGSTIGAWRAPPPTRVDGACADGLPPPAQAPFSPPAWACAPWMWASRSCRCTGAWRRAGWCCTSSPHRLRSIREMCGTDDVHHALELFSHFFRDFAALDASLALD